MQLCTYFENVLPTTDFTQLELPLKYHLNKERYIKNIRICWFHLTVCYKIRVPGQMPYPSVTVTPRGVLPEADVKSLAGSRRGLCGAGRRGPVICSSRISGVTPDYSRTTISFLFFFFLSISINCRRVWRGREHAGGEMVMDFSTNGDGAPMMTGKGQGHSFWMM